MSKLRTVRIFCLFLRNVKDFLRLHGGGESDFRDGGGYSSGIGFLRCRYDSGSGGQINLRRSTAGLLDGFLYPARAVGALQSLDGKCKRNRGFFENGHGFSPFCFLDGGYAGTLSQTLPRG